MQLHEGLRLILLDPARPVWRRRGRWARTRDTRNQMAGSRGAKQGSIGINLVFESVNRSPISERACADVCFHPSSALHDVMNLVSRWHGFHGLFACRPGHARLGLAIGAPLRLGGVALEIPLRQFVVLSCRVSHGVCFCGLFQLLHNCAHLLVHSSSFLVDFILSAPSVSPKV